MSIPTHGPFCQTWVYSTRCWDCQQDIHVLQCTCGSAVLLDALGAPWPKHACVGRGGAGGIGGSGLSGWAAVNTLRAQGVPISPDVRQKIFPIERQNVHNAEPEVAIKRIRPKNGERRSTLAVVRELYSSTKRTANVDALPELGLKVLGLDPKMRYWQITLVNNTARPNKSFTALVPNHLAQGLELGVMVMVEMFGSVGGDFADWVITDINPL